MKKLLGVAAPCLLAAALLAASATAAMAGGFNADVTAHLNPAPALHDYPRDKRYDYADLKPVNIPLLDDKGKVTQYNLYVLLELKSGEEDAADEAEPRLSDAYLRTIVEALKANIVLVHGKEIDSQAVHDRIAPPTIAILGAENVNQVLLQIAPYLTTLTARNYGPATTPLCCPKDGAPQAQAAEAAPEPALPGVTGYNCVFKSATSGRITKEKIGMLPLLRAGGGSGNFDGEMVFTSDASGKEGTRMDGRFLYNEASRNITVWRFAPDYLDKLQPGDDIEMQNDDGMPNYTEVYKILRKDGRVFRRVMKPGSKEFTSSEGACGTR